MRYSRSLAATPNGPDYLYSARSIAVENANDVGEVACNKPEAQAKGIE